MSRNGWLIGGAVVAVVAIVVALIVVSISGGDSSSEPTASEIRGADAVVTLTKGVPQAGFAIGKAGAPVTVREFIDPQCPVCKSASEDIIPAVITGPVKDGTARLIIEPLTFLGPDSSTAAIAIAAAAKQDRGFAFTEILYANQGEENTGWVTEDLLTGIAGSTPGLDVAAWNAARSGDTSGDELFAVADRATANGVNATPTFIITGPGGKEVIAGAKDADEVLAAIEAAR